MVKWITNIFLVSRISSSSFFSIFDPKRTNEDENFLTYASNSRLITEMLSIRNKIL